MIVTAFSGIIVMDGNEKTFMYNHKDGVLQVGCTVEEAMQILKAVEAPEASADARKVAQEMASALQQETEISAQTLSEVGESAADSTPEPPKKTAKKTRKPRAKKQAEAPTPALVVESSNSESIEPAAAAEPSPAVVPESAEVEETPRTEIPSNGSAPEELVTARKLKNVVIYFLDRGTKDPAKIFESCEGWREQVPVLKRATNLKHRIERICEALST